MNNLHSRLKLSALALSLTLSGCGGGGGSDGFVDSSLPNTGLVPGTGVSSAGLTINSDSYVGFASWAYGRITTHQAWSTFGVIAVNGMELSLSGYNGLRAPYNMSTSDVQCGGGGTKSTQYLVTAPSVDAGDAVVSTEVDCSEFTIAGEHTVNSTSRTQILKGGSLAGGIEILFTQSATGSLAGGAVDTQSQDFSFRFSEDADEDMHLEFINLPSSIKDSRSDSIVFNQFKSDEDDGVVTTEADFDVTIGSTDAGRFAFNRFRVHTEGALQVYVYPRSSIFDGDDADESGDDGSKDKFLSGSLKVTVGGQVITITSGGDGSDVRIGLDTNGDGSDELSDVIPFKDFYTAWGQLILLEM